MNVCKECVVEWVSERRQQVKVNTNEKEKKGEHLQSTVKNAQFRSFSCQLSIITVINW